MKKVLIVAEGVSNAHPTRMSLIAEACVALGYDTLFATSKHFLPLLKYEHAFYHLNSVDTAIFNDRLYHMNFPITNDELRLQHQENVALLESFRPDIIFSDFRINLDVLAKKMNIPFINVTASHWMSDTPKPQIVPHVIAVKFFGRTLVEILSPHIYNFKIQTYVNSVNKLRRELNLEESSSFPELYTIGDLKMFPEYQECRPNYRRDDAVFIGPLNWTPKGDIEKIKFNIPGKKVFIGLGSTGSSRFVPDLIKTCLDDDLRVVCSTPMTAELEKLVSQYPDRLIIKNFIPLEAVLDTVDVVICNGGSGVSNHAISKGVPVLGVVFNVDQGYYTTLLKENSLAELSFPDKASAEDTLQKIKSLLKRKESVKKWTEKTQRYELSESLKNVMKRFFPNEN